MYNVYNVSRVTSLHCVAGAVSRCLLTAGCCTLLLLHCTLLHCTVLLCTLLHSTLPSLTVQDVVARTDRGQHVSSEEAKDPSLMKVIIKMTININRNHNRI